MNILFRLVQGENNNQRSVAYGDGIPHKLERWKNMGKYGSKKFEHIGMIEIDPDNSNKIYVAAYGPLWKEGGDRGLYYSDDGERMESYIRNR